MKYIKKTKPVNINGWPLPRNPDGKYTGVHTKIITFDPPLLVDRYFDGNLRIQVETNETHGDCIAGNTIGVFNFYIKDIKSGTYDMHTFSQRKGSGGSSTRTTLNTHTLGNMLHVLNYPKNEDGYYYLPGLDISFKQSDLKWTLAAGYFLSGSIEYYEPEPRLKEKTLDMLNKKLSNIIPYSIE